MQKSRVRAIKLKGWRMVWHDRMRGEGETTAVDNYEKGSTQGSKPFVLLKTMFIIIQEYC